MTLSEYEHLKKQVIVAAGLYERHDQLLTTLKDHYKDVINSPRRIEKITSIGKLLSILELRDSLSEDDVKYLKDVTRKLPNCDDLVRKIIEYEASHVPRENGNYYDIEEKTEKSQNVQYQIPTETINQPYGVISTKKMKSILETVSEEIGTYWKDLARNLKIRENKIDELDLQNKKLSWKADQVLELYKTKADPQRWFFNLCQALEKSRRGDISRSVQNIMAMNI